MKVIKFETQEEWMQARVGKITGTRLKDIINLRGTGKKKAFWEMIAERVAVPQDGENPMDRGLRLEDEALDRFEKETGKKVKRELTLCVSKEDENIAYSSDGIISPTEDVEVKCLNSASHIEALVTKEIPSEYDFQILQGFIVNPKLKKRHFVMYDPRVEAHPYICFVVNRKDKEADIEFYKTEQLKIIEEIEKITLELTGF